MSTASTLSAFSLPDVEAKRRYDALCGLDEIKNELVDALNVALSPTEFQQWVGRQDGLRDVAAIVSSRPALFLLGGDVGSGKTELAQTVGDAVARSTNISVTVFNLSLSARGSGFVGEMTQRIVAAFDEVRQWGEKRKTAAAAKAGGILFIDEADAVAQSRALAQMHHEDRAGVNALIRGIDDLSKGRIPVAVIMATNRLESIDPAIRRRAALEFSFGRPNMAQRSALYRRLFPKWSQAAIQELASVSDEADPSFSYSDIVQRVVPRAVLNAFKEKVALTHQHVLKAAHGTEPTPRFQSDR